MLISKQLIEQAIKHFPRWMDIRKRYFSSIGGQLLSSVAQETAEIQKSIDEYVDQFFIPYYEDKCELIPGFIYKANTGIVDIEDITLVDPEFKIITDMKEFYAVDDCAYYQDGFIFIKDKTNKIFYMQDGYKIEAVAEKIHVWNAYDEFAAFVGIRRYQEETNRELFNRILNVSKHVLNSSEEGLKNAITTSLTNIIPELDAKDIKLERPTAENLVKYYDEFNTVLDKLTEINKDVLKAKKWDIDKWSNDFKQIDYIPHTWDIAISEITNGIGDNNDLKPVFIDAINKTDIELSFYEKSEEYINSYIRDKNMDHKLNLSLVKYNDVLNPYTAKYIITASETEEIITTENSNPICVDLYETLKGQQYRRLEDLIDISTESMKDIKTSKTGALHKDKYYRVRFLPKTPYSAMEIYTCQAENEFEQIVSDADGNIFIFKDPKKEFVLKNNTLVNRLVKKSASKITDFNVSNNITDTGEGLTIDKINEKAELILEANDCNSESLKIFYNCEMSNVLEQDIILCNFFFDKDKGVYVPDTVGDSKNMIVAVKANEFSMTVDKGNCGIMAAINGMPVDLKKELKDGKYRYFTERFNTPQDIRIEITAMFNNYVEISELGYTNYELKIESDIYSLIKDNGEADLYWMPQCYDNSIKITMKTNTQFAPIIKNVFIGTPLDNTNAYETDLITGYDDIYLNINSNCDVELYESDKPFANCDKDSISQTVTKGYSTEMTYTAISNDAYIVLNTAEYISIDNIKVSDGAYETVGYGPSKRHIIRLKNGQSATGVTITGHYSSLIDSKSIHELIKNENIEYTPYVQKEGYAWNEGHKLYVNKLLQCFVIEDNNLRQQKVRISADSFRFSGNHKISQVIIYNLPETLQAAFSSMNEDGYVTIGNTHNNEFSNLYIYPKHAKEYVAKNEYTTYSNLKRDIDIVNTFNNGFVAGRLMAYTIKPINEDECDVKFNTGNNWSIGQSKITVNLNRDKDYNISQKIITESIKLGSTVGLKEIYTLENKELIEVSQYIIDTKNADYEVVYKSNINDTTYDKAEFVTVKNDGFNKLRYSNIIGIKYLGKEVFDPDNDELEEINESAYELDKEKGIIVWKDKDLINSGERLYIIYSIKKAIAVKFNIDALYEKVQYPIKAYKELTAYKLNDIEDGKKIDLINPLIGDIELANKIAKDYKNSDVVYVSCEQPGFKANKSNDILTIKKVAESQTLAIKAGWYYLLGREFYMFATDQSENIAEDEYMTSQEVSKIDRELYFHKKTANYIRNSKMILGSLADSYKVTDFDNLKALKGSSKLNAITACDSYNYWTTFGMNVSLSSGLNGLGLYFEPYTDKDVGYALLDITKHISNNNHISFYSPNNLQVYLGKEKLIQDMSLTDAVCISSMAEITAKNEDDIYHSSFTKEEGHKYYLIVRGQGLLDDIIIQNGSNPDIELHKKNITTLNLKINESTTSGVVTRVMLDQSKGNKNNGAEINSSGYIVNSSNIDWNITKIKSYSTEKDWFTGFDLDDVNIVHINSEDCALMTENSVGKIVSRPIYVGDPNTVKSVVFKINNIPIKSMQGFKVQLLQAQASSGPYITCKQKLNSSSNINYTKDLMCPYIKLSVDIPKNKVIDSIEIYVEYKSTKYFSPAEKSITNGQFITKVFDSHHSATYKLKSVGVEGKEGIADLFIRAAKEKSDLSVWTEWYPITFRENKVIEDIEFEDYRFFQMKTALSGKDSKIKIKYFDLEVVK